MRNGRNTILDIANIVRDIMEEEFLKKINDLYNRSINKNVLTYTCFLTPAEKKMIETSLFNSNVYFFGGIEGSERVRAFFLPEYMKKIDEAQYITAFMAKFSFKELSHRDFLGAILGIGIKRECIGDIYVFEKEAYFFVSGEISQFIKTNLTKVGCIGVRLSEVFFNEVKVPELKFEEVKFTVQSPRLDGICAGIYKESRERMIFNIKEGIVSLNYLICKNVSEEVKVGDIISVKGFGKSRVDEMGGKSRSGKTFVAVKKFI